MTEYTVSITVESGLTAEAVEQMFSGQSDDITVTTGRAVHVADEERVATGRELPRFLDDGCPECGCHGFRTTSTRSIGESYHVEGGVADHVGTDELVQFVGFAFIQCQDCSTTFVEDAEVVYDTDDDE